ncbi:MAG: methionyl-tRNA formyltransferase [Bifidobacteriaceae bacterium]|jgi:methionyl-tRNA formyltransferase|nr:methionyl-tRNA formyltransferase [Bifidobacteriaceae bacterium]
MRIAFAGTPAAAIPALEALAASGHELVAVISRPDRPAGRGRRPLAAPVAEAALAMGLPLLRPEHPQDADFQAKLRSLEPEAVAVVAYGALLPESALAIAPRGWVNLHFSLLPAWRGAAPVQRAIWAGDQITGATTFQIVKELDQGPVFGAVTYQVPPRATAGDVLQTLAQDGAKLLAATMDLIAAGRARPRPQGDEGVSYAPKVTAADAEVDWTAPALAVDRQIRACTPVPGAWTWWRGQRLKIGPLGSPPNEIGSVGRGAGSQPPPAGQPGNLLALKHAVMVATGSGWVALNQVKPAGKGWMSADAWARGARMGTAGKDIEGIFGR